MTTTTRALASLMLLGPFLTSNMSAQVTSEQTRPAIVVKEVPPKYPSEAKKAKIQGTVTLSGVIGKDGQLRDVVAVEGDSLLVQAAKDAVVKWRYLPAVRNGIPLDDTTTISIQFTSNGGVSTRDNQHSGLSSDSEREPKLPEGVYRIGAEVAMPSLKYGPDPRYTERARNAREQGTVTLRIIVTPEGTTRDIQFVKADRKIGDDLIQNAIERVRTWKFSPATKEGQPVPVQIKVQVNFRLR